MDGEFRGCAVARSKAGGGRRPEGGRGRWPCAPFVRRRPAIDGQCARRENCVVTIQFLFKRVLSTTPRVPGTAILPSQPHPTPDTAH